MAKRKQSATVDLKVRMKEPLRAALEAQARKAGHSLNGEAVRRLERSFEQDQRIAELREYADRQSLLFENNRAELTNSATQLKAETDDLKKDIEKLRAENAKMLAEFRTDVIRLEAVEAIFNALVGEDLTAREVVRAVAMAVANNPGWNKDPHNIEKIVQATTDAIKAAASKKEHQ